MPEAPNTGPLPLNLQRRKPDPLCVLRGGGDLATGIAWQLTTRASWPVVVLELAEPLAVRRAVSLATAVTEGEITVQGMRGLLVDEPAEALAVTEQGDVAVLVAPKLAALDPVRPDVVVDARLAKRNIDTSIHDAEMVVALGPGFTAGHDCHAVVETMRGPALGRVMWRGSAQPDTGVPAEVGGQAAHRVLRAPAAGEVSWHVEIGDSVVAGQLLATVAGESVMAPFDGVLRGAIRSGIRVRAGLKIGDLDPRGDPSACYEISDKALAVGEGVLDAVVSRWFLSG